MTTLERFDIDYIIRSERFYRDTIQLEKLRELCESDLAVHANAGRFSDPYATLRAPG